MKKAPAVIAALLAVFVVATAASLISIAINSVQVKAGPRDAHAWIHTQLRLAVGQEKELEPIEAHHQSKSQALKDRMQVANAELADAILEEGKDSTEVRAAINKIHTTMGELQTVTISHVFEMQSVITADQYNKLLHLTADALRHLESGHVKE